MKLVFSSANVEVADTVTMERCGVPLERLYEIHRKTMGTGDLEEELKLKYDALEYFSCGVLISRMV